MGEPRIWKFPLRVTDEQTVPMPSGARILRIGLQKTIPVLWAVVEPSDVTTDRTIVCVGTGNPMPAGLIRYLGTTQHPSVLGELVFHWFEPSR